MTKTNLAVAVFAVAILGLAGGVNAAPKAPPPDSHWVKVSMADLDLANENGAKVAFQRINDAARRVCSEEPSTRDVDLTYPYVACFEATVDHAVGVLGSPRVTALNAARARRSTVLAANRR